MTPAEQLRASLLTRIEASAAQRDATLEPATKQARGVVHTPAAIARFVAREADRAVREHLGRARGIAADDVVIVDPATGPGIFLGASLELAAARGAPRACVGLDVDPGAIARAADLLGPIARDAGWPLTLAARDALASLAPVAALEDDDVVRVVIGNPPWAGRTANRDALVTAALLEDWKKDEHGAPLGERKIGVLSDDYVRFLRWGCELARTAKRGGVIAMVTNGSYLDGPVHRGMRAAMTRWLDRIEVIELGGSSLIARSGARDENVFGVRPVVAIVIGVRRPGPLPRAGAVRVAVLRGSAVEKLAALERGVEGVQLTSASISASVSSPWTLAVRPSAAYLAFPSLPAWMPFHREGLQTNRDELAIAIDRDALIAQLEAFAGGATTLRSTAHWDAEHARECARALLEDPAALDRAMRPLAYRPLDDRFALVHPALCHRSRPALAAAIDASPFALITARKDRGQLAWAHFGATSRSIDNCWLSTRSSCRARAFPTHDPEGAPNLDPRLASAASDALGRALDAETFAAWALAWMASSAYRATCDAALRADYPRIPAPRDPRELDAVVRAGRALVAAFVDPVAPIAIKVGEAPPSGRVRAEDGAITRGGAIVARGIPERALALTLGHDAPLLRWIEARRTPDAAALAIAAARAEAIAAALVDLDSVMAPIARERLGAVLDAPRLPDQPPHV